MLENPIKNLTVDTDKKKKSYTEEVLEDYWICCISREASLLARREVLTGKAKFGIIGDGKEVPQVALARVFKKGDWRSGYYRDQTIMFALGLTSVEEFFAQLYADVENDSFSGGRQMNNHFATPLHDDNGKWISHLDQYNISSDISSTAGQMARAVGLALSSKIYRNNSKLSSSSDFSNKGEEVCFVTIGDASTSEGVFWESINAIGVMQVPMAISVWDDGYGISVPKKFQTTKESISTILEGFRYNEKEGGIEIYNVKGWDYDALRKTYKKGISKMRKSHIPALFHVDELTQPQGHSTSGSHERYKSKDRLNWEKEHDCIKMMRSWILKSKYATATELDDLEKRAKVFVREGKQKAWNNYIEPVNKKGKELKNLYNALLEQCENKNTVQKIIDDLNKLITPLYSDLVKNARRMQFQLVGEENDAVQQFRSWLSDMKREGKNRYDSKLYSDSPKSALKIPVVSPVITENSPIRNGFQILNNYFDQLLTRNPTVYAFGEDVGYIGDVNQGFAGLQKKYGIERVFDTGIREWTIMGQAIGMAMRGLRPIAEIQYLDYLIYGLEPLSDDLATLRYRSNGLQQAPAIIRTRGHRLEGIWHAGSPFGMLINALRGMYICVPRNMTQAVGFYNTLIQSDDPALVVECLNGYRLKEKLPDNIGEYTVPLGVPEVLIEGNDITLVTYGSCVRIAEEGIQLLNQRGISVELIDVQTLLPFDLESVIVESIKKTSRVVFMDEDVPGGGTAYMMQEVLEKQNAYRYLDAAPTTLTAAAHRTPYGSDGDYFSKPNAEDVFDVVYHLMREADPNLFDSLD